MTDDSRLQVGARFKTEVDGIPMIVEIDEVLWIDEDSQQAQLKTHAVSLDPDAERSGVNE